MQRLYIVPLFIMAIGIGLGVHAELEQREKDQDDLKATVGSALAKFESQIIERLTFYSYGLRNVDSLIGAVGKQQFDYIVMQSFAHSRNIQTEFPGVHGFGFIQHVDEHDLNNFIATNKDNRPDGKFDIRHLSDDRRYLFVIRNIIPEDKNASAIGLNIGSEHIRREAAISSARRDEITITSPLTLVQANSKISQGFLMLKPFYKDSTLPSETRLSVDNTWGWSFAPIVIAEVVNSIDVAEDGLIFSIFNKEEDSKRLFYQSTNHQELDDVSAYRYSHTIPVFGKKWQFEARTTPQFVNSIGEVPYAVFSTIFILSLLIALSFFSAHLLILRRFKSKEHLNQLAIAKEQALTETNKRLETLVDIRTQQISTSMSLQKAILDSSTYTIIATDEHGIITTFNPAAEKLLGYCYSDIIGIESPAKFHLEEEIIERAKALSKEYGQFIAPNFDLFKFKCTLKNHHDKYWTYIRRDGKQIRVKLTLTCLYGDDMQIIGYLGIAYDLTEQIRNEKKIKWAKDKAEKATLAKSEFLANMSHEIRTPLNGIQGALQIINERHQYNDDRSIIKVALQSTRSLSLLINDILDLSTIEAGKIILTPVEFEVDDLLNAIYQEFKNSIDRKNVQLNVSQHLSYSTWFGDSLRIKQILTNLLSNAVKFTERGEINISALDDEGKGLTIIVSDTGIGMDEKTLSILFNRFEQADQSITRKYGGTGLGMSITKSLVDLMKGTMTVNSTLDVGSSFNIYLPIVAVAAKYKGDANLELTPSSFADKKVLVAEDNEINQIIIKTMLADIGIHAVIVSDGQEAVNKAAVCPFDCILLDIQMPVLDGVEACLQIKAKLPNMPIIAVTANVYPDDLARYKKSGFDAFVGKPIDQALLRNTLSTYILKRAKTS